MYAFICVLYMQSLLFYNITITTSSINICHCITAIVLLPCTALVLVLYYLITSYNLLYCPITSYNLLYYLITSCTSFKKYGINQVIYMFYTLVFSIYPPVPPCTQVIIIKTDKTFNLFVLILLLIIFMLNNASNNLQKMSYPLSLI